MDGDGRVRWICELAEGSGLARGGRGERAGRGTVRVLRLGRGGLDWGTMRQRGQGGGEAGRSVQVGVRGGWGLESEQQQEGLDRVKAPVDKVAHEEVVSIRYITPHLKKFLQIVKLTMDISADLRSSGMGAHSV